VASTGLRGAVVDTSAVTRELTEASTAQSASGGYSVTFSPASAPEASRPPRCNAAPSAPALLNNKHAGPSLGTERQMFWPPNDRGSDNAAPLTALHGS